MPAKPCHMTAMGCSHCTADSLADCPYDTLTPGLLEAQPATVFVGVCDLEDGVCESCQ